MTPAIQPHPDRAGEEAVADLRAAVAARDEFIAIAAHELRNPMTPIAGQVELLLQIARRNEVVPQLVAGLERLELAVDRYVKRASAILEIGRINTGGLTLEPSSFDMTALLRDLVSAHTAIAARAHSTFRLDLPESVPGTWDRLAVEQVLDNLLSNAIKYGAGAPIDVVLITHGEGVEITVRDRGPGIDPQDRARIFERFEQAVGQRRHGGFGIGLWLTRQLVEAMGGTIAVEGTAGKGSTFAVRLPVDITEADEAR